MVRQKGMDDSDVALTEGSIVRISGDEEQATWLEFGRGQAPHFLAGTCLCTRMSPQSAFQGLHWSMYFFLHPVGGFSAGVLGTRKVTG